MDEIHSQSAQPRTPSENNTQDNHEWVYDESLTVPEDNPVVGQQSTPEAVVSNTQATVPVSQANQEVHESFFERNATSTIFFGNILASIILSTIMAPLLFRSSLGASTIVVYAILSYAPLVISVILGLLNYRGKRKEILRGVLYLFLAGLLMAIVGLGLCFMILGGL